MILKIIKEKDSDYTTTLLEADIFEVVCIGGLIPVSEDYNERTEYFVEHSSGNYKFFKAYLMNNDGKTIERYG